MYRQFILQENGHFSMQTNLSNGEFHASGDYSRDGRFVRLDFSKKNSKHGVSMRKDKLKDSITIELNKPYPFYVATSDTVYKSTADIEKHNSFLKIPRTEDTLIFQYKEEVVWLYGLYDRTGYVIDWSEFLDSNPKFYTNIVEVELEEYIPGFYRITEYVILFSAKRREVAHRMKKKDFVHINFEKQ